jgi:DNA-binding transcriptional ArsR family regulator
MSHLTKAEIAKALRHPLRRRLFPIFVANQPLSPREAARLVGEPLTLVSYHVKELVKCNFLILSSREPVRGALKNYYVPNQEALEVPAVKKLLAQSQPERS